MKKKKILALTGIRSEFDIIVPVLHELKNTGYDVGLIISGAHLSDWHGDSNNTIFESGIKVVDRVDNLLMTNRKTQRAKGVGLLTYAYSQIVERENPDFLIYVGDREEGLAGAIVANYMDIIFIHLAGGDPVFGNSDDPVRFAISKLAHVHCAFAEEYAKNLLKLGEDEFRVFNTGNPSLDYIRNTEILPLKVLSKRLDFDISDGKYLVLIKHPLSSEINQAGNQMKITLLAMKKFSEETGVKICLIRPNTDPGSYDILKQIDEIEQQEMFGIFKSLPHKEFVSLIANALLLAGNSSMGILEAPFYKLPVVNIGNRQQGRLNAGNVHFVSHDVDEIANALKRAAFDDEYRNYVAELINPYGDGSSVTSIVDVINHVEPGSNKWLVKNHLI
jgi:GDP/UDP-N,N'-diacetylbacillosamine 2-epimerase (hydrolysing)